MSRTHENRFGRVRAANSLGWHMASPFYGDITSFFVVVSFVDGPTS